MARTRPRTRRGPISAIALGVVGGMRASLPPAVIALRDGQPRSRLLRLVIVLGSAGELVLDKLPMMPSRTDPPGLGARFASGVGVGRRCAGPPTGLLAGATAVGSAFVTEDIRRDLGRKTGLPDRVIAVAEDSLAIAIARLATRRPLDPTPPAPAPDGAADKPGKPASDPQPPHGRRTRKAVAATREPAPTKARRTRSRKRPRRCRLCRRSRR